MKIKMKIERDESSRIRHWLVLILCLQQKAMGWQISWLQRTSDTTVGHGYTCPPIPRRSYLTKTQLHLSSNYNPIEPSASLLDAFAGLTQASCQLLGVKSIGVDYGLVRTGVAKTAGYQPQAVDILVDLNATQVAEYVVRLAELEGASKIILGLPLHKNGTIAEQTNLTLAFGQVLAQATMKKLGPKVLVELWDERYTSKEAAARAHSRNPHQTLYGTLDAEAACIILEQYYNDNGRDAQIVEIEDERIHQTCLDTYLQQQEIDRNRKQSYLDERERLLRRRKEAILRDQQQTIDEAAFEGGGKKKKKKKKKKRR